MNEKAELFTREEQKKPAIVLTNTGNKCPFCGKEFQALPPLVPNTTEREFYGGRVKFFKEVDCDCGARYKLLIERTYNSKISADELHVMDLMVLKPGKTKEQRDAEHNEEVNKIVEEKIRQEFETNGYVSVRDREKIKRETVLTTILDLDTKINTLCMMTTLELQAMCQKNKVKFTKKDSKKTMAKRLLAKDPNLVSAG